MYSAVTKDDISRSGKSSLQDFLNSTKRTETTIAKAPGQIVQKQSGGEISDTVKSRLKEAIEKRNKTIKNISGAAVTDSELERIRKAMEGREDLPGVGNRQRPMPSQRPPIPRQRPIPRGTMPKERLIRRSEEAKKMNIELKNRSGAAATEGEMQSLMEQMNKPRSMDRFKSGGSVMARGCKLGRKKPTKLY
jgi:hypothetical protein